MTRYKSTKPIDRLVKSAEVAKAYDDIAAQPCGDTKPERVARKWTRGMANHFRAQFAKRLKSMREGAGMSLRSLAEKANVDHSQLVRLESGERSCTLETAVDIAGALGVSLGILVDDKK